MCFRSTEYRKQILSVEVQEGFPKEKSITELVLEIEQKLSKGGR